MEQNLNIVEILKDKPQGTKLYSSACGECKLEEVDDKSFKISFYNSKFGFMNGGEGYLDKNGKLYDDGECVVFPSKEMRDWSKFAWKKGDVLQKNSHTQVIFDSFVSDTYDVIRCKYFLNIDNGNETCIEETNVFTQDYFKASEEQRQCYINKVEEILGGKLNCETLEIEKTQPEFKDGDIVVAEEDNYYDKVIFIAAIKDDIVSKALINVRYEDYEVHYNEYRFGHNRSLRLATDSEKQQLFDALAKEGKAWDTEKKQIVDLKPKCEFKPFDKVLGRNEKDDVWEADLFSHYREESQYPFRCIGFGRKCCIPYEGNEHLLGTTDNFE